MSVTPNLALPLLAAAQAQKHVTHNEALMQLDALSQLVLVSRTLTAPPTTPAEGSRYLVAAGATAGWQGQDGKIAWRIDGAWTFLGPKDGWIAWVEAEQALIVRKGGIWSGLGQSETMAQLGINATADSTNRLAVSAPRTLLTHAGTGHQLTVNKNAEPDTASLLFQTAYSGRAEFGLNGSDALSLKVSGNGAAWTEAFSVNGASGVVSFAKSPSRWELSVFTANGSYAVPAWARWLRIVAIGGGGGGGGGAAGPNTASRFGGGGGASGGWFEEDFDVSEIAATLTVAVGAGGAGGAGVTGTASGANGVAGGASTISSGGQIILYAFGGAAGYGGTATSGAAAAAQLNSWPAAGSAGGASAVTGNGAGGATGMKGAGGGGAGGGIDTASVQRAGGTGGTGYYGGYPTRRAAGGAGGTIGNGGSSGFNKAWDRGTGGGGGGGGAGTTGANGGAGADGGLPSGGGGGGGATRDNATSGAGGAGGRGEVWIIAFG